MLEHLKTAEEYEEGKNYILKTAGISPRLRLRRITMNRRAFLATSAAVTAARSAAADAARLPIRKAVLLGMLPRR